MSPEEQNEQIRDVVTDWINKQGHERCWYYPDLFKKIVDILELKVPESPSRKEFEKGCQKFQDQEFGSKKDNHFTIDVILIVVIVIQTLFLGYIMLWM